jgi:ubiquinone/menaquinone biosynthesis C-methylase UbiE
MNGMVTFDDKTVRAIEAMYSTAEVVEQRRVVLDLLEPQIGEDVLDVGCGPGYLACEIAQRVGDSGAVHGVDPSQSMLAAAARRRAGECRRRVVVVVRFPMRSKPLIPGLS